MQALHRIYFLFMLLSTCQISMKRNVLNLWCLIFQHCMCRQYSHICRTWHSFCLISLKHLFRERTVLQGIMISSHRIYLWIFRGSVGYHEWVKGRRKIRFLFTDAEFLYKHRCTAIFGFQTALDVVRVLLEK